MTTLEKSSGDRIDWTKHIDASRAAELCQQGLLPDTAELLSSLEALEAAGNLPTNMRIIFEVLRTN
jgi:hypothetical protein